MTLVLSVRTTSMVNFNLFRANRFIIIVTRDSIGIDMYTVVPILDIQSRELNVKILFSVTNNALNKRFVVYIGNVLEFCVGIDYCADVQL